MKMEARRGELAGPVLLIGFGILLYFVNTGQVGLSIWEALAKLWPLALIAIGIDLLIPRRSVVGSAAVAALLLVVVLGGAALAIPVQPAQIASGEPVNVPSADVSQARISLSPAAGQLTVDATDGTGPLLAGTVSIPPPGKVTSEVTTTGDKTVVSVSTVSPMIVPVSTGLGEVWDLEISAGPLVTLLTSLGAGEALLDGRGLNLESMEGSVGAGRLEVWVPEGTGPSSFSLGVGEIVIWVPEGVPVRLNASSLLGVSVPAGYSKAGSIYESPDFDDLGALFIDASLGLGSIRIAEY